MTWNTGANRLKGYEPAEVIGRPYATFFTPEDRAQGVPERALRTAAEAGRLETEGWRVRKDGTRFWALAVLDAIRDDTGALLGFAKITRDMTEREHTRQGLLESEDARFRRLVESVVDYAILHARSERRGHDVEPGRRTHSRATPAARSSDSISRSSTRRRIAPTDLPRRALETAVSARVASRRRAGGCARTVPRLWAHVVIDAIRSAGRNLGLRQGHPRHHRAKRQAALHETGRNPRRSRRRRRWKRSAT